MSYNNCLDGDGNFKHTDEHSLKQSSQNKSPELDSKNPDIDSLQSENQQLRDLVNLLLSKSGKLAHGTVMRLDPESITALLSQETETTPATTTTTNINLTSTPSSDNRLVLVDPDNDDCMFKIAEQDTQTNIIDPAALANAAASIDSYLETTPQHIRDIFSSSASKSTPIVIDPLITPKQSQNANYGELPSTSFVHQHPFAATTNISIITQPYNTDGIIWQEAAVFDVSKSSFWTIIPHPSDPRSEQYYPADPFDVNDTPALTTQPLGLQPSELSEESTSNSDLGEYVEEDFQLLQADKIQKNIIEAISSVLSQTPRVTNISIEEIQAALHAVLDAKEEMETQQMEQREFETRNSNSNSWFAWPFFNSNTTTVRPVSHNMTTVNRNSNIKNGSLHPALLNNATRAISKRTLQKEPKCSDAMYLFVKDCIKSGRIDSTKFANQMVPAVCGSQSVINKAYQWISWVWPYASVSYTIYRNPALSRTAITWVYQGVMWAMVFVL